MYYIGSKMRCEMAKKKKESVNLKKEYNLKEKKG